MTVAGAAFGKWSRRRPGWEVIAKKIVGLIAATVVIFAVAYVTFMRQEVRA